MWENLQERGLSPREEDSWRQKGADRRRDEIKKKNGIKAAEAKARQEAVRVRREKKEQERLSKAEGSVA